MIYEFHEQRTKRAGGLEGNSTQENDALENCLIKIVRSESPGKNINKNFGVKAKKTLSHIYVCKNLYVKLSLRKSVDEITGTFHLTTIGHFFAVSV